MGALQAAYVDGGLGYNNPIGELLHEFSAIWPSRKIGCIVSIGTGISLDHDIKLRYFGSLLTDTEMKARDFQKGLEDTHGAQQKVFYRFNVPHSLRQIGLDEWKEQDRIMLTTQDYLKDHYDRVDACAAQLFDETGKLQITKKRELWIFANITIYRRKLAPLQVLKQGGSFIAYPKDKYQTM